MSDLNVGDVINVNFKAKIVSKEWDTKLSDVFVVQSLGSTYQHKLFVDAEEDGCELGSGDFSSANPQYWPPLVGDVWKAGSLLFLGAAGPGEKDMAVQMRVSDPHTSVSLAPVGLLSKYPDVRLVYRDKL